MSRALLQQALDALVMTQMQISGPITTHAVNAAITALREELAAQEPAELTDEQIDAACEAGNIYRIDFIRAYEAAHGIKEQP